MSTSQSPSSNARQTSPNEDHNDNTSDHSPVDGSGNEADAAPKRPRACLPCRNMKIKCRPVEGQDACLACSKVNRECVLPGPPRKRQKTTHKFAELEQKINALTQALQAKASAKGQADSTPSNSVSEPDQWAKSPMNIPPTVNYLDRPIAYTHNLRNELDMPAIHKLEASNGPAINEYYADVIEQGKMDMTTAIEIFEFWRYNMQYHLPVVLVPPTVQAEDVRLARPMLFLAVLTVACPPVRPGTHQELVYELNKELSQRVLFSGEKSLDLVQAMLIYVKNYLRPKFVKDLVFNQYIHTAAVMSLDLGMGKKAKLGSTQDPIEDIELRRTWLACYHVGSSVAILLRHPSLMQYSPYVEECLNVLTTSPHALRSDRWLCATCRLQHLTEEVSTFFNVDDPSSQISFTDVKTLHHLKAFERRLQNWRKEVPDGVDTRLADHLAATTNLYIHEIAIHQSQVSSGLDSKLIDSLNEKPKTMKIVNAAHIDALSTCLISCHQALDAWLSLDPTTARSVPNLHIVWTVYVAVALIKLHGIVNAADSELQSVFSSDLKVDYYLNSVTNRLAELSAGGVCPPAEGFGFIFRKLKSWHDQRRMPWADGQPMCNSGHSMEELDSSSNASIRVADSIIKKLEKSNPVAPPQPPQPTSDLNAAFNAANYNINWDDVNFSVQELNVFDEYMNDPGWMGYLI